MSFLLTAQGQYYYNDIIATHQTNANYQLLRSNKIKKVKAINKDANNQPVEGFLLTQEMEADGTQLITNTATSDGVSSVFTSFFEGGKITRTEEKSVNVNTTCTYVYLQDGKLASITSSSVDTVINGYQKEEHIWQYNNQGLPIQMLKVKNGKDTIKVVLIYDEKGVIAAEQWRKGNIKLETYYYYVDAANRVTDIVRQNPNNGKMIPDWIYEYDANGHCTKMTQVRTGGSNYLVWKYTYLANGLKQKEVCIDKAKQVLGTMEYSYN